MVFAYFFAMANNEFGLHIVITFDSVFIVFK